MKKMKKACAVLLAVLSVSLLASAFAGEHNKHKVENVTPVASDRPVDLDVGDLQMQPAVQRTAASPECRTRTGRPINAVRFDVARGAGGFASTPVSSAAGARGLLVAAPPPGTAVGRLAKDPTVLPAPVSRATVGGKP